MSTTTSITGAVWDGTRALGTATLAWSGDSIASVETADGPSGRQRSGEFSIIPGLVDTHVHLGAYSGAGTADFASWPLVTPREERVFHIANNARKAARAGVTTLRDLGADELQMTVARMFEQGIAEGPRIVTHGAVGMTAGHGDLFVPPHYPHRDRVADSPDECRRLVRTWARAGADGIKIYTSGGVLSMGDKVGWRNQTDEEIAATIDEAHALGMPVAAHTHSEVGLDRALALGVDSIEHGTAIGPQHWATLVERNLPVAPTLFINDVIAAGRAPSSPEASLKAQDVVAVRDAGFLAAGQAGVRFVLGTDANGVYVDWGEQLDEVRRMRESFGWSSERALVAATSDAAAVVGLGAKVGRLAPGFGADFVVLRGRPWESIDDLRAESIVAVVSRGRVVSGELPR
ncbi:amidohydrolase family protein [Rathayibacter festucae]|uniref:Amidohydrolase-related domain-containing protein n=1 Tax=Rathayibacter festucae DSM 15932 TaxID=1328866 RepID=A0A3Q9V1H3_9MICO|nr:amidohydrolase family protein [Rathayibacter festucae]AZZ53132.1 hypothetical protein C1I64_14550 [Rathayibacter festucae DSM 15932]